ncbi:hypothetical protein D9611_006237 [Ephemerocybe angulata]|uniref:Nitronate monooxygenase domain-containing protein n=1 Tax=Ephemerocybe angulata TaxID=980116 RepID=A0A8H5C8C7_9AGAR|nr:hypothetical protein D9611_006237 [Tulosesus angulatus]
MSSPAIQTKLTELLAITTPVVSPAMAYASGGALAAEVTLAGGFGFIGVGSEPAEKLSRELATARRILNTEPTSTLRIGVGFLGWILDQNESLSKDLINLLFEQRVQAVWLSFGNNLAQWIEYIRAQSQQSGHPIFIFVVVSSPAESQRAINEWKADVIVAQGKHTPFISKQTALTHQLFNVTPSNPPTTPIPTLLTPLPRPSPGIEAGGHGASQGLPLLTLLPLILSQTSPTGPPVLGAGGLASGSHIAALLTLGASGAVLGTRFLLAEESLYTANQRAVLIAASSTQSMRTRAFDEARGSVGWPQGIDGRGIRNATVTDYENGVDISVLREKYKEAAAKDDTDRIIVWAGTGVGLMNRTQPAKDIVRELHDECLSRLNDAQNLIRA